MIHLTVRAYPSLSPLASFDAANWMWAALRRAFPTVSAALLMPNHPHLVADGVAAQEAKRRLSQVLRAFTRRFAPPGMRIWQPVPDPAEIEGKHKAPRSIRYVLLNPCRAGLAPDPLAWRWSTLRDVVGASVDPWVTVASLAADCGRRREGFADWMHRYVSADPTVDVDGTQPPRPAAASPSYPVYLFDEIAAAAAAATRSPLAAIASDRTTRALFVALARDQGWRDADRVAARCNLSARHVRRVQVPREHLQAGRLCLGDDRLRYPIPT